MDGLNHPSFIEIGYFAFNAIFNLVYTQSVKSFMIDFNQTNPAFFPKKMHMHSRPSFQFFAEIKRFNDSSASQFMSHKIWFIPWMHRNFHWIHKANNLAFVRDSPLFYWSSRYFISSVLTVRQLLLLTSIALSNMWRQSRSFLMVFS